jgi:hypothetical protein
MRIAVWALLFAAAVANAQPAERAQPSGRLQSAPSQPPERLGRLFLTPQQRLELGRRRQLNIQEAVVSNEGALRINGQVSRSGGKTTTWLNGVPENDVYAPARGGRIAIEAGESAARVPLRVGETFDKARGEVDDGLSGGRVTVNPAPAARR